jgi:hypothetical protein
MEKISVEPCRLDRDRQAQGEEWELSDERLDRSAEAGRAMLSCGSQVDAPGDRS